MAGAALILGAAALTGAALIAPRVSRARLWRAMVTPLASIIGSGFLVLGPILQDAYGRFAPLAMAALCLGAWAFGAAIRFNMASGAETDRSPPRVEAALARTAEFALAFAYVISVAYYLNLFGSFAVRLGLWPGSLPAHVVTTAVYALILATGWRHGFAWLERMEYASVTLKLAIIAGLLAGLGFAFAAAAAGPGLLDPAPTLGPVAALTLGLGLIVTVQGFETAHYLGDEYPLGLRIRAMRLSQLVSATIYLAYVALLVFTVPRGDGRLSETAIIDLMQGIDPLLPPMLVAAALAAQFSAAVADTGGSGGLLERLTAGRVAVRQGYALLVALGLVLTWTLDVFHIIAWASRAFAAYYALQAAIAALRARRAGRPCLAAGHAALAVLGAAITAFGAPAEG